MAAVLPVLEEGESKDATIARLEREKEEETRAREAAEERETAALAENEELKKNL